MSAQVLDRLIELTRNTDDEVKAAAAYALGETGGRTSDTIVNRLIDMTKSTSPVVKIAATKALGRLFRPQTNK
ncbi:HEAT repeat domain-containing protein [Morganella morganii]|uniref:HEAT repeat domain-containing protein n=1 Tax=Morganella morganii TaxID=582 RepID=UPI000D84DCCD|nr:HEAT repeat domain-containing protein [Morganella morganii]MBA5855895.1 HEAT repeat domain-containing protein [Morganella morganii]SPX74383.1 HEAT repeat [Morganella morganii]HCT4685310.1 HEAT repeat domain-containing protein [Morganella morganii]